MHLELWQWTLLILAALLVGLSKTGVAGLGILPMALFANALTPREATGALLPLLLAGDVFGVAFFRKHADWSHLWKLFPWVFVGVVAGFFALDRITAINGVIGGILLGMVGLHIWRQRQSEQALNAIPHTWWFAALTGVMAGFTTMVANAAGPIMIVYLLAMRLPKLVFMGTAAWYFFVLNVFKVPFSYSLGLINMASLHISAALIPFAVIGAVSGRVLIRYIDQSLFELLAIGLTLLAGLRLLFG
jgi:hypothetical protein